MRAHACCHVSFCQFINCMSYVKHRKFPPFFFLVRFFKFFLSITRNILPRQMLDFFKYDITMCALCVILNAAPRFFSPFVILFFFCVCVSKSGNNVKEKNKKQFSCPQCVLVSFILFHRRRHFILPVDIAS